MNDHALCTRVRQLLSPYLDERLAEDQRRAVRAHLLRCAACSSERDGLRRVIAGARTIPFEAPDPGLADRVRGASRARPRTGQPRRHARAAWLAAGCALLVGAVAGAYLLGRLHGTQPAPTPLASSTPPLEEPMETRPPAPDGGRPLERVVPIAPIARDLRDLPEDRTALRAARSVLADLDLLDAVPGDLRAPLLRDQLEHFALNRWATDRSSHGPPAVRDVARLVGQLAHELEGEPSPFVLADLRAQASRPELWRAATAALEPVTVNPRTRAPRAEPFGDLSGATRRSFEDWLAFKDRLVHGDGSVDAFADLLGQLPPLFDTARDGGFALPDLEDLYEQIEWTEEADGTRRGRLSIERSENGRHSSFSLTIQTSR